MPASEQDIKKLKSILQWAQQNKNPQAGATRETLLAGGLSDAIRLLEKPDSLKLIYGHLLAALANAYEYKHDMWIVTDRPTQEWAVAQIKQMQNERPS